MRSGVFCFIVLFCGLFLYHQQILADDSIPLDVLGTNNIAAEETNAKFGKELSEMMNIVTRYNLKKDVQNRDKLKLLKNKIINNIKNMGDFLYVDISCIRYFQEDKKEENYFITIDIVEQKDKHRLAYFLPDPTGSIPDPDSLIKQWIEYKENVDIFGRHIDNGFDRPRLKNIQYTNT